MSELADRLRRAIEAHEVNGELAGFVADAAAELDRLGELLGPAAYQTDAKWSHDLLEVNAAECALLEARGYWERHLAVTGPAMRSVRFARL